MRSYISDSADLINTLESPSLPAHCILATLDVKVLYLSIPHCIEASVAALQSGQPATPFPPSAAREMLEIVLTRTIFEFDAHLYKQICGTAMGTKVAPSYAGLFMVALEEKLLDAAPVKLYLWLRYIDDIFLVWLASEQELVEFVQFLNASHPDILLTSTITTLSVDFLSARATGPSALEYSTSSHSTSLPIAFSIFTSGRQPLLAVSSLECSEHLHQRLLFTCTAA